MGPTEATSSKSPLPEGIGSKSQLLGLPNELLIEVSSHLKSFKDLNSLVRTSRFFHGMFNTQLYRCAVAADHSVLHDIVGWVLYRYRLTSLTLLLDNGLSVNHTGRSTEHVCEETMLFPVCMLDDRERSVPLARMLIQRGVDMKVKDGRYSGTVLHRAIRYDNYEIATLLLAHGADPNDFDIWRETPLHYSSRNNQARMVNLLVAHRAAVNRRNVDGETPLLVAISERAQDVIPMLLAHGADGGRANRSGATPLHLASWFNSEHHELAKSLLARGAVVNARNRKGETPLHCASSDPQVDGLFMAKFLLNNGADVNAASNRGHSPLQYSVRSYNQSVTALLVTHGADVEVLKRSDRNRREWFGGLFGLVR
jgi:hypothetical protein